MFVCGKGNESYFFVSGCAFCVLSRDSLARSRKTMSSLKSAFNFARSNSRRAACRVASCRVQMPASVARWTRRIISSTFCSTARAAHAGRLSSLALLDWRKCPSPRTEQGEVASPLAAAVAYDVYLRGFRDRLRKEESRALLARGELRLRWEIDNFSCSHCCTSGATLVRGALVLQHWRVPLLHFPDLVPLPFLLVPFVRPRPL